jgi:bifunctional oligoribonuclease and PAP phosphatase NrnA
MDGDAFGSLGGLYLTLEKLGKDVRAINDDMIPESFSFLWHTEMIQPELDVETFAPDIIISLDAADAARLGESYLKWKHIFDITPFVVLDHHISNSGFGNINIIDTESSSTCELTVKILLELGLESDITPAAATFFYTGIQTDTNMYATSNTTAETLKVGAKLLELGADFRLPIEKCFREKTHLQITLSKIAYKNIEIIQNGTVSYTIIPRQDIQDAGIPFEKVSDGLKGFINETLINISWVQVAFLLYPLAKWGIKCSMRSKNGYDVNALCQKFGGGGHIQAAGFESSEEDDIILKRVIKEIERFFV